jgi:hypothetical protein
MQPELESFVSILRTVPFETLKLYPEADDSTLDWPYENKYNFHLQAYALNAFELSGEKTLTGAEFKQLFEVKMQVELDIAGECYVLNGVQLFTIYLKQDASGNLYHLFQPKMEVL